MKAKVPQKFLGFKTLPDDHVSLELFYTFKEFFTKNLEY
jgi:hypothetical protein